MIFVMTWLGFFCKEEWVSIVFIITMDDNCKYDYGGMTLLFNVLLQMQAALSVWFYLG